MYIILKLYIAALSDMASRREDLNRVFRSSLIINIYNFTKRMRTTILTLMFFAIILQSNTINAATDIYFRHATLSVSTGLSLPVTDYSHKLSPGYTINTGIIYPFFDIPYLFVEGEAAFNEFFFKKNIHSHIISLTFKNGLMLMYPADRYFQPFLTVSYSGSYLHIHAHNINRDDDTFKPGFSVKGGFCSYLKYGTGIRIGLEYSACPLSKKILGSLQTTIGVTFNYHAYKNPEDHDYSINKTHNAAYNKAMELYDSKKLEEAEKLLRTIDPDFKDTKKYLYNIQEIKHIYSEALTEGRQKKYLTALALLEKITAKYDRAHETAGKYRKFMKHRVPRWEKHATKAYEIQDYATCISILQKIILIDPQNNTAKIYLSRARKRQQALDNLMQ